MNKREVEIGKTLSWILRHGAVKLGLQINKEGYVPVNDILKHQQFKDKFNIEDIKRIVDNNGKQRFAIKEVQGDFLIKANQGHSLKEVNNLGLIPITKVNFEVIHGTNFKAWNVIKNVGLSCMTRNHIHFAKGLPKDKSVISGMRSNAEVYIYINLELALKDKIQFFLSENEVILSPGNKEGLIEPKYFLKVVTPSGVILKAQF